MRSCSAGAEIAVPDVMHHCRENFAIPCRWPLHCRLLQAALVVSSAVHYYVVKLNNASHCSPFVMCLPCHIPSSEQRYLEADEKRDSILFSTEKFPNGTGCPKFQSSKVRNSHVLPKVIFCRLPSPFPNFLLSIFKICVAIILAIPIFDMTIF